MKAADSRQAFSAALFGLVYSGVLALPVLGLLVGTQALSGQGFLELFPAGALYLGVASGVAGALASVASRLGSRMGRRAWLAAPAFAGAGIVGAALISVGLTVEGWFGLLPVGILPLLFATAFAGILLPGVLGLWMTLSVRQDDTSATTTTTDSAGPGSGGSS